MTVLNSIKPGAKAKEVILAVDLTSAGNLDETLAILQELGYQPQRKHVAYQSGVHVLAILKQEQHNTVPDANYLMDEWRILCSRISSKSVHLWRGK